MIELQGVPACCLGGIKASLRRPRIPCVQHKRLSFLLLHSITRPMPASRVTLGRMFNNTLFKMRKDGGIAKLVRENLERPPVGDLSRWRRRASSRRSNDYL